MMALEAIGGLSARELRRFVRRPSRIIASIGTPLLVWVFLAGGFAALGDGNGGFEDFAMPGMALLVAMFSSVFASISLIADRNDGFLRAALVSPAPRFAIVVSKVGTGTLLALAQAGLLLAALSLFSPTAGVVGWTQAVLGLACGAAACIGLGLGLAWWIDSAEGFHGVMNLVLMPMWLLSGAFTPPETTAPWFDKAVRANPMSAVLRVVRDGLSPSASPAGADLAIAAGFAAIAILFACITMSLSTMRTATPKDPTP